MYIYGASGHAKVVIDILEACGRHIDGLVDDNPDIHDLSGYPVGRESPQEAEIIVAIGNCATRRRVASRAGRKAAPAAVHPSAVVSPRASVGDGTVVMPGAIIQADANIGRHCIINTKASVDHECVIGDYVHIAPGCTLSGDVKVGEGTWIGAGATVIQGISIGRDCYIGAGAVVVNDIPDGVLAYGVPCRIAGKRDVPADKA